MQTGDLLKRTRTSRAGIRSRRSEILGILLEEPTFPRYGNFPKNYRVLTPQGNVMMVSDDHRTIIEVVQDQDDR